MAVPQEEYLLARKAFLSLPAAPTELPDYRFLAACTPGTAELFFDPTPEQEAQAKAICRRCPVLHRCREYIDDAEEGVSPTMWFGIWGGESVRDRRVRRGVVLSWEARRTPQLDGQAELFG